MGLSAKLELRRASRLSTALLLWDTIFRFQVFQSIFQATMDPKSSDFKTASTVFNVLYLMTYSFGTSILFAYSFEYRRISYFQLSPFQKRFYILLFGMDQISKLEIEKYKFIKEERKIKYRDLANSRFTTTTRSTLTRRDSQEEGQGDKSPNDIQFSLPRDSVIMTTSLGTQVPEPGSYQDRGEDQVLSMAMIETDDGKDREESIADEIGKRPDRDMVPDRRHTTHGEEEEEEDSQGMIASPSLGPGHHLLSGPITTPPSGFMEKHLSNSLHADSDGIL